MPKHEAKHVQALAQAARLIADPTNERKPFKFKSKERKAVHALADTMDVDHDLLDECLNMIESDDDGHQDFRDSILGEDQDAGAAAAAIQDA